MAEGRGISEIFRAIAIHVTEKQMAIDLIDALEIVIDIADSIEGGTYEVPDDETGDKLAKALAILLEE